MRGQGHSSRALRAVPGMCGACITSSFPVFTHPIELSVTVFFSSLVFFLLKDCHLYFILFFIVVVLDVT